MIRLFSKFLPFVLVFSAALTGCSTPQRDRLYTLNSFESARKIHGAKQDSNMVVRVAGIPDAIDRTELLVLTGTNQFSILDNDIWAEPIKSGISRVLRQNLQSIFPDTLVLSETVGTDKDITRVQIWIEDMSVQTNGNIRLDATWIIQSNETKIPRSGKYSSNHNIKNIAGVQEIVAAWSDEFLGLSQKIADSLIGQPGGE